MWQIEHTCPQCSAPVTMEETDRLFTCPYCKVRLYMASSRPLSYCLDPKSSDPDTLYVPYGRFRGMAFAASIGEKTGTVIDGNTITRPMLPCPGSLGVRPQAMKLHMAGGQREGRFVQPSPIPFDDLALAGLRRALGNEDTRDVTVLRRFLREAGGLVYNPFRIVGTDIIDAVTLQRVGTLPEGDEGKAFQTVPPTKLSNDVAFLPALCPNCGADLGAAAESIALPCTNCGLLWEASGDVMVERKFFLASDPKERNVLHLPFWRMSARADGLASVLHVDPLKHIPPTYGPPVPISFPEFSLWVPAFFVNPVLFLRLSERATVWQSEFNWGEVESARAGGVDMYPVTLPAPEAEKLLALVLSLVVANSGKVFPLILHSDIVAIEQTLVFLPFRRTGNEAVHGGMRAAVELNALKHALSL